ncbi:hypothetical protein FOA52_012083 [Chlamydomonas sp. UWO 241]|nr:hypothetical protein FOA52_012083 [Chlamydomonas sp. UWO 241]
MTTPSMLLALGSMGVQATRLLPQQQATSQQRYVPAQQQRQQQQAMRRRAVRAGGALGPGRAARAVAGEPRRPATAAALRPTASGSVTAAAAAGHYLGMITPSVGALPRVIPTLCPHPHEEG